MLSCSEGFYSYSFKEISSIHIHTFLRTTYKLLNKIWSTGTWEGMWLENWQETTHCVCIVYRFE
jgi:hypothetical protein